MSDNRKTSVERHRNERRFAVPRDAFDADVLRVHSWIALQVVEARAMRPMPKRATRPNRRACAAVRGW